MRKNPALLLLPVFVLAYVLCKFYLKLAGGLQIMLLGAIAMCVIFAVGSYFQKRR